MAALSAPGQHGHLVGHHGPQTTIYSADGIKQELIQIPQLSSSTSSPDSSPIPGHGGVLGGQFGLGPGGLTGPGGHPLSGAGLELVKWGSSNAGTFTFLFPFLYLSMPRLLVNLTSVVYVIADAN